MFSYLNIVQIKYATPLPRNNLEIDIYYRDT